MSRETKRRGQMGDKRTCSTLGRKGLTLGLGGEGAGRCLANRSKLDACCCYLVARLYLTFCHPMDCSLSGSSVHGIFQARILEWVTISFSRGSSRPRDQTCISRVSCTGRGVFTTEPPGSPTHSSLSQPSLFLPAGSPAAKHAMGAEYPAS